MQRSLSLPISLLSMSGAMIRGFLQRDDFTGKAVGVDQCPAFINAARKLAGYECQVARLRFVLGDYASLTYAPFVASEGLMDESEVDRWLSEQLEAIARRAFFYLMELLHISFAQNLRQGVIDSMAEQCDQD